MLYGLSDSNAADASADLDADGVNNLTEYQQPLESAGGRHGRRWAHRPAGDRHLQHQPGEGGYRWRWLERPGRSRHASLRSADTDSDNDGYTDFDEVLYGGNPNDPSGLPQPLTSYSQTFEGTPNLAAWTTPSSSSASLGDRCVDTACRHRELQIRQRRQWADQQRQVPGLLHGRPAQLLGSSRFRRLLQSHVRADRWSTVALFVRRHSVEQPHASDHARHSRNRMAIRKGLRRAGV